MIISELFVYQNDTKEVAEAVCQLLEETNVDLSVLEKPIILEIDAELNQDVRVDSTACRIVGRTSQELFHGVTAYLLLASAKEIAHPVAHTAKIDERCVMIDIGRKFYSLNALKALIRSMAWFQFTHLQLHFSENEGFRIESDLFPEIVSEEHLKKKEIKALIAYAKNYFIEIIPDLDSPGHLEQALKTHPEWQLPMASGEKDVHALNILNAEAVSFMKALYEEYGDLFAESAYFHIGGDEFIDFDALEKYPVLTEAAKERFGERASGIEVFIEYVNNMIDHVASLGFTVRVWNDGFYRLNRDEQVSLSKACQISYWTHWNPNMAPVSFFFENGYQVINHNDNFFYYVLGEAAGYTYPTYEKIQETFQLTTFANNQTVDEKWLDQTPAIALAIWADIPEARTGRAVIEDVFWIQAAMTQKVYGIEQPKTTFAPLYAAWQKGLMQ